MIIEHNKYHVEISDSFNLARLQSSWQPLEEMNDELSFFHSWQWLNCWFNIYKPDALLATVKYEGETIALGIFGKHKECRHKLLISNQLRLFQTGNNAEDQIWVEFNDLLCHPDHTEGARYACLKALLSSQPPVDEIVISMMRQSRARNLIKDFPHVYTSLSTPSFRVNLSVLTDRNVSYLDSLSRNTRYQINRSIRGYESLYGDIKITFAKSITQASTFWDEAGKLHVDRWDDSGFQNPKFVEFHQEFIRQSFDTAMIDVVKITAGSHLIAIIYNIIYKGNVYFYLQGLQPEKDGKLKPGLAAHSLLIEHYLQTGIRYYDFMGGDSQYKQQLSEEDENLLLIKIQKPRFKFRVERFAHTIKQLLPHFD